MFYKTCKYIIWIQYTGGRSTRASSNFKGKYFYFIVIKWEKLYQRDAKAPHVCSDVIVRFGGIWRVYSLRLQEHENRCYRDSVVCWTGCDQLNVRDTWCVLRAVCVSFDSPPCRQHSRRCGSWLWSRRGVRWCRSHTVWSDLYRPGGCWRASRPGGWHRVCLSGTATPSLSGEETHSTTN